MGTKLFRIQIITFFADFYRVNRLALSNPRVSCTLGLDRRLSSVIKKLENKFRPQDQKTWLNCVAILPPKSEVKYYSGRPKSEFEFWIVPRPGATLSKPSVATQEPTTSTSLSLSHLQSKLETTSNDEHAKQQVRITDILAQDNHSRQL